MSRQTFFTIVLLATIMIASLAPAEDGRRFAGVITDSMCADGDHSAMNMGPTDAECTKACIDDHGAAYVLYDGKTAYFLDDQKAPEKFAGRKVVVTGALDVAKKTIHVSGIVLASGGSK